MDEKTALVVFQDKKIRRVWYDNQWYFSVVDVVEALTDSTIPRRYWADLKSKVMLEGFELYDKIVQLKLLASASENFLSESERLKKLSTKKGASDEKALE